MLFYKISAQGHKAAEEGLYAADVAYNLSSGIVVETADAGIPIIDRLLPHHHGDAEPKMVISGISSKTG